MYIVQTKIMFLLPGVGAPSPPLSPDIPHRQFRTIAATITTTTKNPPNQEHRGADYLAPHFDRTHH